MRVVFFGTPEVAVPSLLAVLGSSHEVTGVVTQPDRVRGRGREPSPSSVKRAAEDAGLPVLQPESPKLPGFADALEVLEPEALAVVAYGHILPIEVLQVAPAMNVHFSLLPRYRGAAPVQRALMDGVTESGVSVFMLEPTIDTGPVLLVGRVEIGEGETAGELLERLAPLGAELLVAALDGWENGTLMAEEQEDAEASRAPKITAEETEIDWSQPAQRIVNVVRALSPKPGAHTTFRGKRLIVLRARLAPGTGAPGEVLVPTEEGLVVAAGEGAVEIVELRPEGKGAMEGAAFARGYRPEPGTALGR
jgi:methionyl-tRNA formyltransferase